jgi:hypothetical protein
MQGRTKNTVQFNENYSPTERDVFANEDVIRKDGFLVHVPFLGTAGATAANYDQFFTAMRPMEILVVSECHSVASSSGTLQIEKLTGTQAPGAGSTILLTTISTAGAANTVITRQGPQQLSTARTLKPGDRLAFIDAGTLTGLVGLHVTLYCKFVGRGDYL